MPIFLSGALFPLKGIPKALEIITRFNPLTYGFDGLRGALSSASHYGLFSDFIVLLVFTAIALGIGTYLFSKIEA